MGLFTEREKGFGNAVVLYPHELIFMDTGQKIDLFDLLVDSGSCYKNEVRTAFGMKPLPELAGQIAMSSNKTNAENNKTDEQKIMRVEVTKMNKELIRRNYDFDIRAQKDEKEEI